MWKNDKEIIQSIINKEKLGDIFDQETKIDE